MFEKAEGVVAAMKASHHATLQEVMEPDTLSQLDRILRKEGFLFCYGPTLPRPICKRFLREAAQMNNVILTKNTFDGENSSVCAFSFGACVKSHQGLRVDLWMYSLQEQRDIILAHIRMHLARLVVFCREQFLKIVIFLPKFVNCESLRPHLDGHLGVRVTVPPYSAKGSGGLTGICMNIQSNL